MPSAATPDPAPGAEPTAQTEEEKDEQATAVAEAVWIWRSSSALWPAVLEQVRESGSELFPRSSAPRGPWP